MTRTTKAWTLFLATRLVANLGGAACDAFPGSGAALYADRPLATDDPYRYFRW